VARSLPRIAALTLCAAAIGPFMAAFGFAADTKITGAAIAIVDFNYVDTSGEMRDQRTEHEMRLSVFMSALKNDLAAGNSAWLSQHIDLIHVRALAEASF
jgi:hypothetical protein